jgi:hypothetical protein
VNVHRVAIGFLRHGRSRGVRRSRTAGSGRGTPDFIPLVARPRGAYDAGPLFEDVVAFLAEHRFSPIAFEGVLDDERTGEMLQVDAIFRST